MYKYNARIALALPALSVYDSICRCRSKPFPVLLMYSSSFSTQFRIRLMSDMFECISLSRATFTIIACAAHV